MTLNKNSYGRTQGHVTLYAKKPCAHCGAGTGPNRNRNGGEVHFARCRYCFSYSCCSAPAYRTLFPTAIPTGAEEIAELKAELSETRDTIFEQRETIAELKEQMRKAGGASEGYTGVVP